MPELPEVERARKLIDDSCKGFKIDKVNVTEDKIVYAGGITHEDYVTELTGRTITGCERKGKIFWMTLSGEGRLPVMHFGMNGMVQIKGQEPTWYVRRPRERPKEWPPKYYKFTMDLIPQPGSVSDEPVSLAFLDSRRLARLKLVTQPVIDQPPVSALGFDPVLNMPDFETFLELLKRKKGTIKGVIMDQAFSAGVGNWVADEILYQSRIHPACPVPALSQSDLERLHHNIWHIPLTAVQVNAEHGRFPEDWLFRWRWGKGKKQERRVQKARDDGRVVEVTEQVKVVKTEEEGVEAESADSEEEEQTRKIQPKGKDFMALPDGRPATITFIEVGGRTTAVVEELQKMPEGVEIKPKVSKGGKGSRSKKRQGTVSDEGSLSSAPSDVGAENVTPKKRTPRKRGAVKDEIKEELPETSGVKDEPVEADTENDVPAAKTTQKRSIKQEPGTSSSKKSRITPKSSKATPADNTTPSKPFKVTPSRSGKRRKGLHSGFEGKQGRRELSVSSGLSDVPDE